MTAPSAPERICTDCGHAFPGYDRKCPDCRRTTERTCARCGETFTAKRWRLLCAPCANLPQPRTNHQCTQCGRTFKGTGGRCNACYATERQCDTCGRTFKGRQRNCPPCWYAALPADKRAAMNRRKLNARRARKLAAEVTGPVPDETYEAIAASGPCVYCYRPAGEVDHVRPLGRGGPEAETNLVPACKPCNSSKGNRLLTEWDPLRVQLALEVSPIVRAEWERLTAPAVA